MSEKTEQGLNLSDRVWRYATAFKREIELGLDLGIRTGESAAKMTRSLRQYLQHPDKLFRRVRYKHGNLKLSKAAAAFHPGRGVYRSSYKNARRLAATETNIAYRTSDHLRWQQMDFVVGIEIKLSNNHTLNGAPLTDICDTLAGRYPKDFKFVGWHPHCRCKAITVLKTEDEMAEDTRRILNGEQQTKGSVNTVRDVPAAFKYWVEDNADRIEAGEKHGTLPYFIRDNQKKVTEILRNPVSSDDKASKSTEAEARIEANRREYERLKSDPQYKDVEFNPKNGGVKAIHIEHENHSSESERKFFLHDLQYPDGLSSTDLELICQDILFHNGYSCILESEHIYNPFTGKQLTSLDTTTNRMRIDIRSITENNTNTIKNGIKAKKKQLRKFNELNGTSCDSLILYFHNPSFYNENAIRSNIGETIKRIIVVFRDGKIKEITEPLK